MPTQSDNNRLFLRGETASFQVTFFEDAAGTIPVVPFDAGLYPAYEIFDPNNNVVQSGLGTPEVSPGRYKADFIVPPDAKLSNDLDCWRIEWVMVGTDERQVDFVEEFSIKDTVITASETREQKFITLAGEDYRAMLRLPHEAAEVALDVFASGATTKLVNNAMTGVTGGIQSAADGDSIVYFYDLLNSVYAPNCFLSLIWKVREGLLEPQTFQYQSLTAVTPSTLNLVTCLRMLLDKFQKRLGTIQSYEDSDLTEYLIRGHELVNSVYPTTFYGFGFMPAALTTYHLLFSAWYGLQAQRLLEVDLGFDFSGQTVTMTYDHASGIADVASAWNDYIRETLPAAKQGVVRATSSVGTVAGRGYRYNSLQNFSYKIASFPQGFPNVIGQLQSLGILF